jgi:hypothetical protein
MRILVMGTADTYTKDFIQYCLLPHHDEIYFLTRDVGTFFNFYRDHGVHLVILHPYSSRARRYLQILQEVWLLRGIAFDYIFIFYVSLDQLKLNFLIKTGNAKSIACFLGDDVNSVSPKNIRSEKVLFHRIDRFNFYTKSLEKTFRDKFGTSYRQKITHIRFGLSLLNVMDGLMETSEDVRGALRLPREKVVVAIGYNNIPEQQHLSVLEQIGKLPYQILEQMHLVLSMTYGGAEESYLQEVWRVCECLPCTYTIYQERLDERDKARLTLATDIFIHAQVRDAFSGTIQEHLYAGALVINPTWIHYDILKNREVFYLEYTDFDELGGILKDNFFRKEEQSCHNRLKANREKIHAIASWEHIASLWDALCEQTL